MILRCLIVDDEPLAHAILSDYVSKVPFLKLVGATTSPIDALTRVQRGEVDLVFLDIQMPELTGIQFLKIARSSGERCHVILTTAYADYALEGYEHDVIDYLLKPISFERFFRAVQKAYNQTPSATPVASELAPQAPPVYNSPQSVPTTSQPDFVFVKTEYRLQRVSFDDILYCEGLKDYVSIYTPAERILALQTMKALEEKLPVDRFVRVHKSYIVPLSRIESVERNRIYIGKAVIPIGDTYREAFFKRIDF